MTLDDQYKKLIENVTFKPIFILGLPRSGTTILYKILVETQCFNYVSVYNIINYNNLLYNHIKNIENKLKNELNQKFKKNNISNRGIDNIEVNADSPEEYGYILYNKGFKSSICPNNLSLFFELSKKIQFISKNNKPLLLKNPWDFKNFIYIKKFFPESKFIFIHRHPFNAISSGMRTQRFIFKEKPFYHSLIDRYYEQLYHHSLLIKLNKVTFRKLYPLGFMLINNFSVRHMKYFQKNIVKLSTDNYINIKYEDLCEKPSESIEKILDFLDIKQNRKTPVIKYIKPRNIPLDPFVIKIKKYIYTKMKNYFEYFGYENY